MKTTEEKTAVQVAQEIPCACYDCGINGLKATEMIQAYADQQVLNYKTQLRKEVSHLLVITGSTQYFKVIQLIEEN